MRTLKDYIAGTCHEVQHYLTRTRQYQKEEDIHQMRVSVKRLRAGWDLLQYLSDGEVQRSAVLKPYKLLFRKAGKLREAQVNENRAALEGNDEAVQLFRQNQENHRQELIRFMLEWNPPADTMNQVPEEISKLTNRQVLQQSAQLVQQKISEAAQDSKKKKLHDARKHLKVVQEVLRIMHFIDEDKVPKNLVKQVKKVTSLLGTWHDYEVLAKALEKHNPSPDYKKEQKKLLKKIAKDQQQREKEIYCEFNARMNHESFQRLQEKVNPEVRIIQKGW